MTPASDTRLARVQARYRLFAPVYDAFRWLWVRWTRSSEAALDRLFAARVQQGARILELGPGTGVNLARVRRLGIDFARWVGLDASDAMLARARAKFGADPRVELRRGDINDLSALPAHFDFVVSTWVLSHLEDPAAVVRAAVAHLAPGGSAVFLYSGTPTTRLLRAILRPFYQWAAANFVDPEALRTIPGCESIEHRSAGLATLAVFHHPIPSRPAGP